MKSKKEDSMKVEAVKQNNSSKIGKKVGTVAGLGLTGAYVAIDRKEMLINPVKDNINKQIKTMKDSFLSGVSKTAENNLDKAAGKSFTELMHSSFDNFMKNNNKLCYENLEKAAEKLGTKKDIYINGVKESFKNFDKTILKTGVKGVAIAASVAALVMAAGALAGRIIGGAIGKSVDNHKQNKVENA